MGLAGRFARSQARSGQSALGFGFPLESAARRLAASVRQFQPVRHPSRRPARQVSFLFSSRRFTGLITVSKIHAMHHNCHQWLTSGYGKTVSETGCESGFRVMKNSGELKIILLETPIKSAILLALNWCSLCNPGHWLHLVNSTSQTEPGRKCSHSWKKSVPLPVCLINLRGVRKLDISDDAEVRQGAYLFQIQARYQTHQAIGPGKKDKRFGLPDFGTGCASVECSCGCSRQSVNEDCNNRNPPVASFTPQNETTNKA